MNNDSKPAILFSDLLLHLSSRGMPVNRTAALECVQAEQERSELPLYLRAVIALGAFLASSFFLGFLLLSGIIDMNSTLQIIIWGIAFIGVAVGSEKLSDPNSEDFGSTFLQQLSFSSIAIGKTLVVLGFAGWFESEWGVALGTLFVTGSTYFTYRMSLDRFFSTLAVLSSIHVALRLGPQWEFQPFLLNSFFVLKIIIAGFLFTSAKVKRDFLPIGYALLTSVAFTIVTFDVKALAQSGVDPLVAKCALLAALILLIAWAGGEKERVFTTPIISAWVGALFLGCVSTPGIIFSILLLVLGYARHDRAITAVGLVFLPAFLAFYYYSLSLSLAYKSALLVGSGIVLLGARLFIQINKWDEEVLS